ncbi:MAG: hypothetical protein AABZ12_12830 [Planctomycetota bacterium]
MSQYTEGNTKTFTAGAAIGQHLRVKLSSGKLAVAVAGVTDEPLEIGTMVNASFADLDLSAVRLRNAAGTCKMIAAGAVGAGVAVYGAAAGKISTTASGAALGISMEAAAADGDIIEVQRY